MRWQGLATPASLAAALFSVGSLLWNVLAGDSFIHMFKWEGARTPTYLRVIRLADLVEVIRVPADAFFTFRELRGTKEATA